MPGVGRTRPSPGLASLMHPHPHRENATGETRMATATSAQTGSTVSIDYDGKSLALPVITGSEGETGIDIAQLRNKTGMITLDPGFGNTGSCQSAITFIDGERGILRYRGYPIEELAAKSTFLEVAWLLMRGELPTARELATFE